MNLSLIVLFVSIICSVLVLIQYRALSDILKVFGIYFLISNCIEILALFLAENKISNLFLFHINTVIEFWFLVIFFYACDRKYGKPFPLIPVLLQGLIIIVANSIFVQKIDMFNSYSATLVNLVLLIFSFRFFFVTMDVDVNKELKIVKLIVSCLLLVFGTSLVVLLFSNAMLSIATTYQLFIWDFRGILILSTKVIFGLTFAKLLFESRSKTLQL